MNRATKVVVFAALLGVLMVAGAGSAAAAPLPFEPAPAPDLDSLGLKDSSGISVDRFTIDVNDGNRLNMGDTPYLVWSMVMSGAWELYKLLVTGQIWLLQWALKVEWVQWVLSPLTDLGNVTQQIINQLGLPGLAMALLSIIAMWWLVKGKVGAGISELLIGCFIAAVTVTFLAYPMETIAGEEGIIFQGRDAGMNLATAVVTDGDVTDGTDPNAYIDGLSASMVDSMIRVPHQIINYGQVIDGTDCASAYSDNVGLESARENIRACNEDYKTYSDSPNAMKAFRAIALVPIGLVFSVFVYGIIILLIWNVAVAAFHGIKLIATSAFAVLPGKARSAWLSALGGALGSAVAVAATVVFIVIWMRLVRALFSTDIAIPWTMLMQIVSVFLVIGPVMAFLMRHRLMAAMKKASKALSQFGPKSSDSKPILLPMLKKTTAPKNSPASSSSPSARPPASSPKPKPSSPAQVTRVPLGVKSISAAGVGGAVAGAALSAAQSRPSASQPDTSDRAAKLKSRVAQGAGFAVQAAATAASGGTTAVGARALQIAQVSRSSQNTALRQRLDTARPTSTHRQEGATGALKSRPPTPAPRPVKVGQK